MFPLIIARLEVSASKIKRGRKNMEKTRGKINTGLLIAAVGAFIFWGLAAMVGDRLFPVVSAQQTDPFVSRRVDQLEQRFYQLESKIDRVEQEARRPAVSTPSITGGNDAEMRLLRSELDSMRLRLGEAECGLLHVDERTLTLAARAARKKALAGGTENCRSNSSSAIELSARP